MSDKPETAELVPALSYSIAKTLIGDSPRHAWCAHPLLGGVKAPPTVEMDFGQVAHRLLLGKGQEFAVFEGESWRGKEAAAFWDKAVADHVTPIKRTDHTRALALVSEVRRQLQEMGLGHVFSEAGGIAEEKFSWTEGACHLTCVIDWHRAPEIWDLKITNNAHPKSCAKKIINEHLDMQEEFCTRALASRMPELQGRIKFRFLFVEDSFPFCITPYENDGTGRAIGVSKTMRAFSLWEKCMASGRWPGYAEGIVRGETPEWAMKQEIGA
jgi:hypothetical protein